MHTVFDALTMLRPFDISLPKKRIGPQGDGGYVLADCISAGQVVLSYGISDQYEFDQEMANNGHRVLMFDPTIERLPLSNPNMSFFEEGCAGVSDGHKMFTIEDHLLKNQVIEDRLILKMDVEGFEYETILAMSDEALQKFEQIALEIHNLHNLEDYGFRERFCRFMIKINSNFTLFHVHANNFDGADHFKYIAGLPTVNLIELSFIKTSRVVVSASRTVYPTYLDTANVGGRDKLLWIYPYAPMDVDVSNHAAAWARQNV